MTKIMAQMLPAERLSLCPRSRDLNVCGLFPLSGSMFAGVALVTQTSLDVRLLI